MSELLSTSVFDPDHFSSLQSRLLVYMHDDLGIQESFCLEVRLRLKSALKPQAPFSRLRR